MSGHRRWVWLAAALGGLLVVTNVYLAITTERELPVLKWSPAVIGSSFLIAGTFASRRRPENPIGQLITLCGFGWLIGGFLLVDDRLAFTVGLMAIPLSYGLIVHTYLAFPYGYLQTQLERRLVALTYAIAVATTIVLLLDADAAQTLFGTKILGCEVCPVPLLDVGGSQTFDNLVTTLGLIGFLLLPIAAAMPIILKWRRSDRQYRAAVTPVLLIALPSAALFAVIALLPHDAPADQLRGVGIILIGLLPLAFVWVLLSGGFAAAAGEVHLTPELAAQPGNRELDQLVGRALGDPTARVLAWDAERGNYVDKDGNPVADPPSQQRALTPMRLHGEPIGAIDHEAWLLAEGDVVGRVGEVLALAIENEQLAAARREALEEVRDSRQRIVTAGDTERARIARDIHDTAQRSLMLLAMEVRGAARKPPGDDYAERLEKLAERLDETNDQLRSMVHGIMPLILTDRGLAAAVEVQVMGMPLRVRYTKPPPGTPRPAPETERAAYFLVSEGLTNIVKYAEATEAWVTIKQDEETLTVEVRDNGRGGADQALGSGLRGTEDRVAAIDGELEIISPPGEGTTLRARLPVAGRRSAAATPAR